MLQENRFDAVKEVLAIALLNPLIFDTETTGLDENAELCDIAIVEKTGEIVFDSLVKTVRPISAGAEAVHHISNGMIANSPTIMEVIPEICRVIKGRYLVAYNAEYDFRLLFQSIGAAHPLKYPMLEFSGVLDLMKPAARYYGEYNAKYGTYKYKKLGEIAAFLGISFDDNLHRARADALLTAQVLNKLADLAPQKETVSEPVPAGTSPAFAIPEDIYWLVNSFVNSPTRRDYEALASFIRSLAG